MGGALTFWGMTIPGYLVIDVADYSAATSYGMLLLGRLLVDRVEPYSVAEADFRFELLYMRDNAVTMHLSAAATLNGESTTKDFVRSHCAGSRQSEDSCTCSS